MTLGRHEELSYEVLSSFLQRFAGERRTGTLMIRGEGAKGGRIELYEGQITRAVSPFVRETIGEVARKLRFVTREDIHRTLEQQEAPHNAGKAFGSILVEEGLITPEQLTMCLQFQIESTLYSLLGFHGSISFSPGRVKHVDVLIPVAPVLAGIQQRLKAEVGELDSEAVGPAYASEEEQQRLQEEVLSAGRPPLAELVLEMVAAREGATAVLLRYARHYAYRVAVLAASSRGMRVMGAMADPKNPVPDGFEGVALGKPDPGSHLYQVLESREPYVGPFQKTGGTDEAFSNALGPVLGDVAVFPIAVEEQAIGLLFLDGLLFVGAKLDDLRAAVAVTAVAMENKLLTRKGR
jgi:hypothetical protein